MYNKRKSLCELSSNRDWSDLEPKERLRWEAKPRPGRLYVRTNEVSEETLLSVALGFQIRQIRIGVRECPINNSVPNLLSCQAVLQLQ